MESGTNWSSLITEPSLPCTSTALRSAPVPSTYLSTRCRHRSMSGAIQPATAESKSVNTPRSRCTRQSSAPPASEHTSVPPDTRCHLLPPASQLKQVRTRQRSAGGLPAASGSSVIAYQVTSLSGGTVPGVSVAVPPTATSAILSGLAGGTSYTFEVRAEDAYGWGPNSNASALATTTGTTSTYSSLVLADQPSAYYRLGDSTDAVMADSSGKGGNGVYNPTSATLGVPGAIVGDPDTAVQDTGYYPIGTAPAVLPVHNGQRSVEVWLNDPSLSSAGQNIVSWGDPDTDQAFQLDATANSVGIDGWNDAHYVPTPYPINDGGWHQLVVTYNGSTFTIYLDGEQIGAGSFDGTLDTPSSQVMIGSNVNGQNGPDGDLDEVSIYPSVFRWARIHFAVRRRWLQSAFGASRRLGPRRCESGCRRLATVDLPASAISTYLVTAFLGGTKAANSEAVPETGTRAVITGLSGGTAYTFEVVGRNSYGSGPPGTSPLVTPSGAATTYASTVLADAPSAYYRLGDSTTTLMADSSGNGSEGSYDAANVTLGIGGAISGDANTAVTDLSGWSDRNRVAGAARRTESRAASWPGFSRHIPGSSISQVGRARSAPKD